MAVTAWSMLIVSRASSSSDPAACLSFTGASTRRTITIVMRSFSHKSSRRTSSTDSSTGSRLCFTIFTSQFHFSTRARARVRTTTNTTRSSSMSGTHSLIRRLRSSHGADYPVCGHTVSTTGGHRTTRCCQSRTFTTRSAASTRRTRRAAPTVTPCVSRQMQHRAHGIARILPSTE